MLQAKHKITMYLLYTQLIYIPVRPKTNRALRHVQMRQLDLSKFKKFTRSIRQKEVQIVKEQDQRPVPSVKNFFVSATAHQKSGGARRDRTADLLRARQALSQLSYGPKIGGSGKI
jgi:Lhr-like helicase